MLELQNYISIDAILSWVTNHRVLADMVIFLIAWLESMVIIGLIMPGAITMPAIGFLVGTNLLPASTSFMWATLGGILGDLLSYLIGLKLRDRLHLVWPLNKYPKLLAHGNKFFNQHGGKGVFISRFIGPMRAIVPTISGACGLPLERFLLASIPATVLWSVVYMLPGILLGALALELPSQIVSQLAFVAILVLASGWLIFWLSKFMLKKLWWLFNCSANKLEKYLITSSQRLSVANHLLVNPTESNLHSQLLRVMGLGWCLLLFLVVTTQAITDGSLCSSSKWIYYLLSSCRNHWLDAIFIGITILGEWTFLLVLSGLVFLLLSWKRNRHLASHWLSLVVLIVGTTKLAKTLIYTPRPGEILHRSLSSAFPSAHVALSTAIYGFLAVIIAREVHNPKQRQLIFGSTLGLVTLIAISRIYLGAHWFQDLLGGGLLGMMILLPVIISYYRKNPIHFKIENFIRNLLIVLVSSWCLFMVTNFSKQVHNYTPHWPQKLTTLDNLTQYYAEMVPSHRLNRLGKPVETFNLVYVGELEKLRTTLQQQAWEEPSLKITFNSLIKKFSPTTQTSHLPILTPRYHHRKPSLLLIKPGNQEREALILRLWPADIGLVDNEANVWIGGVERHYSSTKTLTIKRSRVISAFVGATEALAESLAGSFLLQSQPHPALSTWHHYLLVIQK